MSTISAVNCWSALRPHSPSRHLLTEHQIRGALASYFEFFKPEFKSIAFSGWGPELIPDDDILQSQFPEILAEMEQKRCASPNCPPSLLPQTKKTTKTATIAVCYPTAK